MEASFCVVTNRSARTRRRVQLLAGLGTDIFGRICYRANGSDRASAQSDRPASQVCLPAIQGVRAEEAATACGLRAISILMRGIKDLRVGVSKGVTNISINKDVQTRTWWRMRDTPLILPS